MAAVEPQLPLFADGVVVEEEALELEAPSVGENLYADYATLGTTLGPRPLTLLRPRLMARRLMSSRDLAERRHGQPGRVAGLVVGRQRPGTASGITFVTLEDEFGMVNVVVQGLGRTPAPGPDCLATAAGRRHPGESGRRHARGRWAAAGHQRAAAGPRCEKSRLSVVTSQLVTLGDLTEKQLGEAIWLLRTMATRRP